MMSVSHIQKKIQFKNSTVQFGVRKPCHTEGLDWTGNSQKRQALDLIPEVTQDTFVLPEVSKIKFYNDGRHISSATDMEGKKCHLRALGSCANVPHDAIDSFSLRQQATVPMTEPPDDSPHVCIIEAERPNLGIGTYYLRVTESRAPKCSFSAQSGPYMETVVATSDSGEPWDPSSPNRIR